MVVEKLRGAGHDVHSIRDMTPGVSDDVVIRLARQDRRIIVTHDRDFGNVIRYPIQKHVGVILLRLRKPLPEIVAKTLIFFLSEIPATKFQDRLAIVGENGVRFFPA